jgi:integrase
MFLDTRRNRKKTTTYPVKLRVTFDRKPQEYQTVFNLTQEDYNKLGASRINDRLKEIQNKLNDIQTDANKVAKAIDLFTFEEFEKDYILHHPYFHQRQSIKKSVLSTTFLFDRTLYEHRFPIFKETYLEPGRLLSAHLSYIDKLLQEHRIGSAVSYQTSYYSFFKFRGNVRLTEITPAYLHQYESWMLTKDYSKTTIGIYTRQLRTLFNEAIEQGLLRREKQYPFGRRKYVPPTGRNVKKALTLQDVAKLYYYQPECEQEQWAKDFWFFSYLANGINTKDIALLKYRNIQGEYLVFERAKTEKSTRTDPKPISVFISEDLQQIINRWRNKDSNPNHYLFPILSAGITPMRQYELIELFVASINDWMRKIKKKVDIERNITCYVARHTFSTIMKRAGASTEFIQEALGHTNIKTTENYLDSFEKEVKKEFAAKLVAFKTDNHNAVDF